ncbi:MAG: sulfotransferase family 2 domain-containing protein [Planctomycetaceae bacterium]
MISHAGRFVFVHASRTGGSTFERMAGVPITSDDRTRHLGNTDFPGKHGHFQFYRSTYPEAFDRYFKFTIVRNPFDRLHSSWKWRTRTVGDLRGISLRRFIESRSPGYAYAAKFRLDGLSIGESVARFDYVGRFEHLAETLTFLQRRLGLPDGPAPSSNSTGPGRYQEDYDDATIDLVRRSYADDLALFGYDFEPA